MGHGVMCLFRRVVGNIVATLMVVVMVTAVVMLFLNGKNETGDLRAFVISWCAPENILADVTLMPFGND